MASKFMDGYTPEPETKYRNDWERSYALKKKKQTPKEREEDMKYYTKNLNLSTNESKKNVITLTESDLKKIITESVKQIINEASNSNIKRSMMNKISKGMRPFTSKLFRDNGWENVTAAFEHMREIVGPEGQVEVTVKNGGYRKGTDGISGQNKEYHFEVFLSNGVTIGGILTCCQAGTVQDPWSAYDMTLQMW
jgi:hypothetical protein